ncbi:MAG: hypothetical protein K1X67_26300 [Fimbriimonadaceae bacterium]|nr:hypothetical protein [Fimbriimonadaceae bacterium]
MGFWHTGYLEFHEPAEESPLVAWVPRPPKFPCPICGLVFSSEPDLRIHTFEGHPVEQPVLVLNGRECGRRRLTITYETSPGDWVVKNADAAWINNRPVAVADVGKYLSEHGNGVRDLILGNKQVRSEFQFELALAEKPDLEGVDSALQHLILGADLSPQTIDAFIMRSRQYPTATQYCAGLADYLYGVVVRETDGEGIQHGEKRLRTTYEDRFNGAVGILGTFDRPPAEAICGIVAFHYNQFERAMTKTRSQRVARVSLRFKAMLSGEVWDRGDLALAPHASLDYALSDAIIENVLAWCAVPLDGTADPQAVAEMVTQIDNQRPYDQFKLHLIAAEHFLAADNPSAAARHADLLRYGRANRWFSDFRNRLEG